jgi:hypothetical protein
MKTRKLTALLLAVLMLTSVVMPVYAANDPTTPGPIPATDWTLVEVNHWVVRGETLQGIADRYGTRISELRLNNRDYFEDLRRRNKTNGVDIELEHGVKLFIYHMVRATHYVRRGDTLWGLANGDLKLIADNGRDVAFTIMTTQNAIRNENRAWFASLAALNATRGSDHDLNESYDFWNVSHNYLGTNDNVLLPGPYGAPLVISVPVQLHRRRLTDNNPETNYMRFNVTMKREKFTFMRNYSERTGNPELIGVDADNPGLTGAQIPFENTMPTNSLMPRNNGWTRAIGYAPREVNITPLANVPGYFWTGDEVERAKVW